MYKYLLLLAAAVISTTAAAELPAKKLLTLEAAKRVAGAAAELVGHESSVGSQDALGGFPMVAPCLPRFEPEEHDDDERAAEQEQREGRSPAIDRCPQDPPHSSEFYRCRRRRPWC